MPPYDKFAHNTRCAFAGHPAYLFGKIPNDSADCVMQISQVALASNVATLTVQVLSGDIPVVGQLVSVRGTSQNSGVYNVTSVPLTAVSINASTGAGTLSYAVTGSNQSATADAGRATVPIQESTEAIANGASIAVTFQYNDPQTNTARTLTLVVNTPANTLTGTVTAQLQEAVVDQDSEYQALGSSISIPTTAQVKLVSNTLQNGRFYRLLIAGITGGSGTIIAKLLA